MFPYQIYQVLADQHIRDLRMDAGRHARVAEARWARRNEAERSSRLKSATGQLMALLHLRGDARDGSTMTSTSGAGPMGCVA